MSVFIKDYLVQKLRDRGVTVEEMAKLLLEIQLGHMPYLTYEQCVESIERVLDKREVQNAALTGLAIDSLAEQGLIEEPLLTMLTSDDGLYGVDEILALSIVNIYGSIGLTNFGFLDKAKLGLVGKINEKRPGKVTTFLDDIVAAIVASGASRLAHRSRDGYEDSDE